LCREEYNKVSGLDNAKQIWDTLKISHEGNDVTMLTKMELVEGKLGKFTMIWGEEPTQTYNRLKTLVNKIRSYGSTRWTDVNHLGPFGDVLVINDNCLWTNDSWRNKNAGLEHIEQEMLENHKHW
jgi:hypothetical protein